MLKNLFLDFSIPSLVQKLADGEISYLDLCEASVAAVEENEASTHAWVCFDKEKLRSSYKEAEKNFRLRGYAAGLEGLPFGVKDIFNTKDYPTQMGSAIWKDFTPGNNSRVLDSLLGGGAIIAGKTVTAEFAVHSLNETLNPHDQTKTPGTSSSGSAAAVARGMVPFALATQTAASIIRPASFCGVWGMKPSFGLIPRTGVLKTTDSLDTIGFVAAHGTSLRSILDNSRVRGLNYPFVNEFVDKPGINPKPEGRKWRVGFVKTHVWEKAEPYARDAVEKLARALSAHSDVELEEVSWPSDLSVTHEVHSIIYNKSLSYYFKHERQLHHQITPLMLSMIENGEVIDVASFQKAIYMQEEIVKKVRELLSGFDVVLSLSTSSSAPLRNISELPDPSLIWTMAHVPSVHVPMFRCPLNLPFGPQFVSRKWGDYLLLQFIEEFIKRKVLPEGSQPVAGNKTHDTSL